MINKILSKINLIELETFYWTNYNEIRRYHPYCFSFRELIEIGLSWVNQAEIGAKSNLNILDLGTCGGHIPFIYNSLGHNSTGLEMANESWMIEMVRLLNVKRIVFTIEKQKPLEYFQNLDYITGFNVTFDYNWKPVDWEYFINHIKSILKTSGGFYFLLNYHWQKEEYIKTWEKLGIKVEGNKLRYG